MATISIVVPVYNEAATIMPFFTAINPILSSLSDYEFEFICVNDGSTDDTLNHLINASKNDHRIIVVDLSRNFGKEAALTAQSASGLGETPSFRSMSTFRSARAYCQPSAGSGGEKATRVVLARRSNRISRLPDETKIGSVVL